MQSIEFCAGVGGQALGLEQAGFRHAALVEIEPDYAQTLRLNRPAWEVHSADMNQFDGRHYKGMDLLAGGLPCPPFSIAGKQLGERDERNLFPAAIRQR
jgi:DNA (cytosine-5)-methyltransferase 1